VLDGRAYAVAIRKTKAAPEPLTAEGEAEKPTRKPPARKGAAVAKESEPAAEEPSVAEEPEAETDGEAEETSEAEEAPKPKKKTRRGSRGGRKRKKAPATAESAETEAAAASEEAPEPARGVTIHVPGEELGREGKAEPAQEAPVEPEPQVIEEPTTAETAEVAGEVPKPKKKTRRGSRGGKNRKKKPAAAAQNGAEAAAEGEGAPDTEPASENGDFEYVPMSEWVDELESKG
jgi:ribonuclease E